LDSLAVTTWSEVFAGSPRYAAIESVFKLIEKPAATINEVYAKMGWVMMDLNAIERDALPGLAKAALVDREPVRVGPPPF
jgi:hypothetical protein